MYFKVPDLILREFVHVAGKNENNTGHIETMALLVGRLSSTETIVTKLIYPDQSAGPFEVRSEGKIFQYIKINVIQYIDTVNMLNDINLDLY